MVLPILRSFRKYIYNNERNGLNDWKVLRDFNLLKAFSFILDYISLKVQLMKLKAYYENYFPINLKGYILLFFVVIEKELLLLNDLRVINEKKAKDIGLLISL